MSLAIVTGGSTGIGRHLVQSLCEAGYAVAFSYRSGGQDAADTVARLSAAGHRVWAGVCDVGGRDEVERFTKSAAVELGSHGITVNCVAPGAIATERTAEEALDYAASWSPITPMGRVGTPEDVAGVVLFFAGPAARFVTGQTLWVDGGVFSRAAWPYR